MELIKTKSLIDKMYSAEKFGSYAISVYKDGKCERLMSDEVNGDTYFDTASMGKVLVTSTLILKAINSGNLNLNDTLDMFFDNIPNDRRKITVQQLLTHTSGIVRCNIPDRVADCGTESVAAYIISNPLAYKPGSDYRYSCNGYILLGFILEKIYKKSLDKIYYDETVSRLGLTRSCFNIALDEPNTAVCYRWREVGKRPVDDENVYTLGGIAGSGASFSSLNDIERFAKAVLEKSEKLYSNELFDLAERDYTPDFAVGRGLGYLMPDSRYSQTGKLFSKGSFGHCGHCGHSFFIDRKMNMYVIILTNATRYANMKNNFAGYDYAEIMKMREDIHNAIKEDVER